MPDMIEADDPRIALGHAQLAEYWSAIGQSDPDFISYLINPMFQGKPAWPNTRQAYRVVRTPDSLIIASDGLSDPFVDTDMSDSQGFGCEVYIETPQFIGADFETLRDSWAFKLIENFTMNVADWGGISHQLEKYGVISAEFEMSGVLPTTALTDDGSAGFLVNLKPPGRPSRIDMPFGLVDIVALTLLSPNELGDLRTGGAAARQQLATKRTSSQGHWSRLA